MSRRPFDLESALLDPASVLDSPEELLERADIELGDKVRILKRWEMDARALQVAEEENMQAPVEAGPLLGRVRRALRKLVGPEIESEESPPTKQGG